MKMVINESHLDSPEALQQLLPDVLKLEELQEAADAAAQKAQIAEARSEQWAQIAMKARREEEAYLQILRLRRDDDSASDDQASLSLVSHDADDVHPVIAASIALLRQERRPMHIGELMNRLQAKSVRIPGSGEQANLISYLRRDDRIVRPSRGVYGLRELGLEDMAPAKRRTPKKRPRARKRSKNTTRR